MSIFDSITTSTLSDFRALDQDDDWKKLEFSKWGVEEVCKFFNSLGCGREIISLIKMRNITGTRILDPSEYEIITNAIARSDHTGDTTKYISEWLLFLIEEFASGRFKYSEDFRVVHDLKIYQCRKEFWHYVSPKELVLWIRGMLLVEEMKSFFFGVKKDLNIISRRYKNIIDSKYLHIVFCKDKTNYFFGVVVNDLFISYFSSFSLSIPLFINEEVKKKKNTRNSAFTFFSNYDEENELEEIMFDEKVKKKKKKKTKKTKKFKNVVLKEIVSEASVKNDNENKLIMNISDNDIGLTKEHNLVQLEIIKSVHLYSKNKLDSYNLEKSDKDKDEDEDEDEDEGEEGRIEEEEVLDSNWFDRILHYVVNLNTCDSMNDFTSNDFVIGLIRALDLRFDETEYNSLVYQKKKSIGWFNRKVL